MAALLERELFGTFGTHTYATSMTTAAPSSSEAGSLPRRPLLPPQPVPVRHQAAGGGQSWEDAATQISASPASSDVTEQFLDCYSEIPSASSSLGDDGGAAVEELISRALPRLSTSPAADALAAASSSGGSTGSSATWQLQQERQRRLAAETAVADLQHQLDDISAVLFAFRSDSRSSNSGGGGGTGAPPAQQAVHSGTSPVVAAVLEGVLQEAAGRRAQAAEQAAALQQLLADRTAAAAGEALVARLVAGICARAATAADLEAQWQAERALLERRLEQAARMGQAMLKHQKEHSAEPEPWRQQLLNTAFAVGCSILGAAAAVAIIRRAQGA